MSHMHHIVPKHMGGTDDPANLINVSVKDHAEAHRLLFEEYGHWQDYVAWQGLLGLLPKEELIKRIQSEAARARLETYGNPFSGIRTWSNFSINEEFRKAVSVLANNPEAIAKKKKTFAKINHQQGSKNSQYGSKWCVEKTATDISNRKKFKEVPEGWITTSEWKEQQKNKLKPAYGKHWYNDGIKNYYLYPSDTKILELHLEKRRLISK